MLLRAPDTFQRQTLWPEFLALATELDSHLAELTDRVIREAIHSDVSEASEPAPQKALPEHTPNPSNNHGGETKCPPTRGPVTIGRRVRAHAAARRSQVFQRPCQPSDAGWRSDRTGLLLDRSRRHPLVHARLPEGHRLKRLVAFNMEGNASESVANAIKDLEAQARAEKATIKGMASSTRPTSRCASRRPMIFSSALVTSTPC